MSWLRVRFKANGEDYRPVKWPPVGPFWCTGYSGDHAVVVAYVKKIGQVHDYWPEAEEVDSTEEPIIEFTDRFQRPEWWKGSK